MIDLGYMSGLVLAPLLELAQVWDGLFSLAFLWAVVLELGRV
jgi:hypothetical protein